MDMKRSGYIFTLLAVVIFAIQDGISKHLGGLYPPAFIAMIRFWAFGAFAVLMAARSKGGLRAAAATRRPVLQILRGVMLAGQIVIVITSLAMVGLAHSQAIFSATPLFVALLSVPLLGEKVGWRRWTAILLGLVGVLVILEPSRDGIDPMLLVPLAAAAVFSLYVIATRLVSRDDSATTSFFYIGTVGAITLSFIGPFYWTGLAAVDWGWMALLCITGMASHYFLIRAYDLLDATAVQPLTYLQLVFAGLMGVTLFDERLTPNLVVGSAVVVGAGIFTIWRESVAARRRTVAGP
ncbi:DMT family transporter [Mycoplana ramosa]|uniref:DMT family transporter n=1 Tax=Mycoplana ramosa TaxID=40837 RepID=A0ABW3YWM2_MYCRA